MESNQQSTTSNVEMDELDLMLKGYDKKMDVTPGVGVTNDLNTGSTSQPGPLPNPNSTPFSINRDPNANTHPVQEVYVRGPKKGQPKPPKKGQPAPPPPANNQLAVSTLISGALFITMIDLLLPLFIAGLNNIFNKKAKIDPEKMRMSATQRNDLSQVGDAVVRELKINASPTALLLLSLCGIYGFNAVLLINQAKKESEKAKQKQNEKTTQSTTQNNGRQNDTVNPYRNIP